MSKRVEKPAVEETTVDDVAVVFPLSKPVMAYGEEVTVLKLRKPTGADLIRVGNPVIFYPHMDPPKVEHDMARVVTMIARLANIPSSSVALIEPDELTGLAWAISPFFIPAR